MLVFFYWTGIGRGFHAILIGHVALAIPYVVLVVGTGLATIRTDLEEAAMSLGARPASAFLRVTLPLLLPSIVGAALFAFAVSLDQFVVSYFLATPGFSTLPVEIYSAIRKGFTPEINAICTILLGGSISLFCSSSPSPDPERPVTAVDVSNVAKSFGATAVLSDLSAHFPPGSFTSLLGPSGSGKTTLLRIVAGFAIPDRGQVSIDGRDVTHVPVWARNIGMVFQSYALFPHMTVAQNVAFGLAQRGIRGEAARREVARALEMVRLDGFGSRKPKQLSGGQQQRVALARAIVTRPSVLLLDEPLSALDRRLRQEMQVELLRIQRESGLTTIFVTHDQEEALALSDTVAILDRGRIAQIGPPAEVYERPANRFAAEFLGDTNLLSGKVAPGGVLLASGQTVGSALTLPATGQEVTLAVRPEKIEIIDAAGAPEGWNRIAATITASVYAGAAVTYEAEAAGGLRLKIFAQNRDARPRARGEAVVLAWRPEHTVPLVAG